MISELLCVNEGKIVMRNIASKLLLPKRDDGKFIGNKTDKKQPSNR
jgi:hypothetical protein